MHKTVDCADCFVLLCLKTLRYNYAIMIMNTFILKLLFVGILLCSSSELPLVCFVTNVLHQQHASFKWTLLYI